MIQFYSPDLLNTLSLGPEEAFHCVKVLRKRKGDIIYVTDGRGRRYETKILEAGTRDLQLEIISECPVEKSWENRIAIAVAPTKNADRMAWLVEKATEIGVDEIRFLNCRYGERKNLNIERLRKNAISAMNQSLKTRLPEIYDMDNISSILDFEGEKFFGYCNSELEKKEFSKEYQAGKNVIIAIGPEGDFSEEEVDTFLKNGFEAITFGNERLRTETAALFGVTAVHVIDNLHSTKL